MIDIESSEDMGLRKLNGDKTVYDGQHDGTHLEKSIWRRQRISVQAGSIRLNSVCV